MCRSHPTTLLAALAALSLGGCILMPAPNIHHGTQVTPTGIATVPRLPPFRVSDEATQDQLLLALAQGDAVGRAVDFLTNEAADHGAGSMAGEYQIAYAISVPEGAYVPTASGLRWQEPRGNVQVGVVVRDGQDGRLVPEVRVLARFLDSAGRTVAEGELPYAWHPLINHFTAPLTLPGAGRYTLHVEVLPPDYRRHDPKNGDRFEKPVFADFTGLDVDPHALRRVTTRVRPERQAELARAQGDALSDALHSMIAEAAVDGALTQVGDVQVAYAVEFAESFWFRAASGALHFDDRNERSAAKNAHIEVAVLDAPSGRFLPGLRVHGTLLRNGHPVVDEEVPLMWHPWLYHYGDNVRVPRSGRYSFRIRVEPPPYPRYGRESGAIFREPVEVEFTHVALKTGQK